LKEVDNILKTKVFIVMGLLAAFLSTCSEGTATTDDSADLAAKQK